MKMYISYFLLLCFLVSFSCGNPIEAFNPAFPINGIVVYYKLDGDARDATGDHDGSIHGATYATSGKINGCYRFDGSNDYIDTNYSLSGLTELTISIWFKPANSPPSANEYVIASTNGGATDISISWRDTKQIRCSLRTNSGTIHTYSNSISDAEWHHVVWTWRKGGDHIVYLDGSQCNNNTAYNEFNSYISMYIGDINERGFAQGQHVFTGEIDEVGIWERELLASEVYELYNLGSGLSYP